MRPFSFQVALSVGLCIVGMACGDIVAPPGECSTAAPCAPAADKCHEVACVDRSCVVSVKTTWCSVGGVCYQDGDKMPGGECLICDAAATQDTLVSFCGLGEVCAEGQCVVPGLPDADASGGDVPDTSDAGADDVPGPDDTGAQDTGSAEVIDGGLPDELAVSDPGSTDEGQAPDPGPTDSATPDDAEGTDAGVSPLPCVAASLDPAYGAALETAFTLAEDDDFAGTCGGDGAPDIAYEWTVPFTAWFTLDTEGSDFDTVLYLLAGACDGPEVACSDNATPAKQTSRIVRHFTKGDRLVVIVDGSSGTTGNAVLNIQPVTCPAIDLEDGAALPALYSTADGAQDHGGDCGGSDGPERSYRFTPPETGLWRVSAKADVEASFNAALYLERGPACGGVELQCNSHSNGSIGVPTAITRVLPAGEPVTIIVDSLSGAGGFELDAEKIGEGCPAMDFDMIPVDGVSITDFTDTMTSSCGQNAEVDGGGYATYPDFVFVIDTSGLPSADLVGIDVSTGFESSLAVIEGACTGAEIACTTASTLSTATNTFLHSYTFPKPGGVLTVVVSPIKPAWQMWQSPTVTVEVWFASGPG